MKNSFNARRALEIDGTTYQIASLPALRDQGWDIDRLPFATRILLENLLRREDGDVVPAADIEAVANWDPDAEPSTEIAFMPARVILQDFTGVPAIVDLAAMRDAMVAMGGDPSKINPQQPVELVIDHSVQVDEYGSEAALMLNVEREFERNFERYAFLRWGQSAFENFRVVPPATGIVHQVNLEYLGRVVMRGEQAGETFLYPDTLVGTDSHTTMINGLGILGWGVGGIEAEAAMLGQPVSMLLPQVVGFRMVGALPEGATATDLVLRVTEMLRRHGVVGKFVEFFGPGLAHLALADRATIANMAPEYGATCGIFPIDDLTLEYLRFTGRDEALVRRVEAYAKAQDLFQDAATAKEAIYSSTLELDLSTVEPSLAGPKRPQDRIVLGDVHTSFTTPLPNLMPRTPSPAAADDGGGVAVAEASTAVAVTLGAESFEIDHGSIVIAAITSCTNTSNPSVMVAAGLVARKARARGLDAKPWVKTSLAPGSKVVTRYLEEAKLMDDLEALKFHTVGYGCTTCIGNSGPLPEPIAEAIRANGLVAASVLSGNRNFEGRIGPDVRANYLASPPLVVAYAIAGRIDFDMQNEPLGQDGDGNDVYLKDIWPSQDEIRATVNAALKAEMFETEYADVFTGDERWRALPIPEGATFDWDAESTYVQHPPFFENMPAEPPTPTDIVDARVLALMGDSVTTDHISPAGAIKRASPAGAHLESKGVTPRDFNYYGSRRGNHEIMMRGTFANVRLRNQLVDVEGGYTRYLGEGASDETISIFDAAMRYTEAGVPTVVLAGKEYGTGSSRDWAAKGPSLLGVKAAIAVSYERIHRSNLIGMGVLPLEFVDGDAASLGLTGHEYFTIRGLAALETFEAGRTLSVEARSGDGATKTFTVRVRLDTPQEVQYWRHGGILRYVLRQLR
ncbi:MAG: aconitate hydratase AcnA [Acidobacteriota bacterium]